MKEKYGGQCLFCERCSAWRMAITQVPPPPNLVEHKTQPKLWENTQIHIFSLKSLPPNIWVRTQIHTTKYLSTYSNKKIEYVLKFFEIALYLSQVYIQATKMATRRRQLWRLVVLLSFYIKKSHSRPDEPLGKLLRGGNFDQFRFRPQTIHFQYHGQKFVDPRSQHNQVLRLAPGSPTSYLLALFSDRGIPPPYWKQYWGVWNNYRKML